MPSKYSQVYLHLVWSTWNRSPMITEAIEPQLHAAIASKCRQLKCEPIAIGSTDDHIHLLVSLNSTISISKLMKDLKGSSSHLMNHKLALDETFKWQGGYGVFSVSVKDLPKVRSYIVNQKKHHSDSNLENTWEPRYSANK